MNEYETSTTQALADAKIRKTVEAVKRLVKTGQTDEAVDKILAFHVDTRLTRLVLIQALLTIAQNTQDRDLTLTTLEAFDKVKRNPVDNLTYYNVATSYSELYEMCIKLDKANIFDCADDIKNAIKYFEKAGNSDPRVTTNLGNLFDGIGRPIEAIDQFDLAIKHDKTFGMATGNKALAIEKLTPVVKYQNAYQIYAHQLYQEALSHFKSIEDVGGRVALEFFRNQDDKLVKRFKNAGQEKLLTKSLRHPHYDDSKFSPFVKFYTKFCIDNNLYLNTHIFAKASDASISDGIAPRFITDLSEEGEKHVNDVAFRLNEIIEAYMTARMALVQSQHTNDDFSTISNQTALVNALDYSVSNIYVGHLKAAYKEAFSALDKIAILINHYLDLDISEDACYYRDVWFERDTKGQKNEPLVIAQKVKDQGARLFGLYLLCQELCGSEYSSVRNTLTHRYLRVYRAVNGPKGTYSFEDLTQVTVDALYKIKCAIIYVSLFIDASERMKHVSRGRIIQGELHTDQNLDIW